MESIIKQRLSYISEEDQTAIQKIVSCFVEALHPLSIYLFGSFAENRITDHSDYDFYIIVDDSVKDSNLDLICQAHKSIWGYKKRPCDIIADKISYFKKAKNNGNTIESEVFHKGVSLYER